jgi:hypothetical protein
LLAKEKEIWKKGMAYGPPSAVEGLDREDRECRMSLKLRTAPIGQ